MNIILNLKAAEKTGDADFFAELTQFLEKNSFKLSVQTLPDCVVVAGAQEKVEEVPQEEPQPEAPVETAAEEPMAAAEVPAVPETLPEPALAPAPTFKLSFEQVAIVNLDASVQVPASYDATRDHSVLRVASQLAENSETHCLKFKYGDSEYSVPIFDEQAGIVENSAAPTASAQFRALIKLSATEPLHAVRLGIEVSEGATEVIFGSDMANLITAHGEQLDASVS